MRQDRDGDVLVLVIQNPPVNALSHGVRQSLATALDAARSDPEIRAIVIRGDGKAFSAGADIAEFGKPGMAPNLGTLCLTIENFPKPVIAALHGVALGGGLEIALAAHYRIANQAAMLGLPEVNLGLLPGAGGTQRLPRLVGAEAALRLILVGAPITAAEALSLGLIDRVVDEKLHEAALAFAREGLLPRKTATRTQGLRNMQAYQASIAAARLQQAGHRLPAPSRIIDCIEAAALLPFDQGLGLEQTAFADLLATPEAAGLRYAFFAERRASQPPAALAAMMLPKIEKLGLWGTDATLPGLVFQTLTSGAHVLLAIADRPDLVAVLEQVAAMQEEAVVAGTMTEDLRDADWARLTTAQTAQHLLACDLVLSVQDGAAASGLDPARCAILGGAALDGPALGLTAAPARGGLAEISMTDNAPPDAVARVLSLTRRLGWRVVFAGPGGSSELQLRQALAAAQLYLVAEGVSPDLIMAALAAFGMGPQQGAHLPSMPQGGDDIVTICMAALAAEGARLLDAGQMRRPIDIDALCLLSGLVPRWEGGPMFQADRRGLLVLRRDLRAAAATDAVFEPSGLIDALIADGKTFASLNQLS